MFQKGEVLKTDRTEKMLNHVNKWKVLKITVIFLIWYMHFPTKMVGLQSEMITFIPVRGGAGPRRVAHHVLWATIKAVMLLLSFSWLSLHHRMPCCWNLNLMNLYCTLRITNSSVSYDTMAPWHLWKTWATPIWLFHDTCYKHYIY